MKEDRALAIAVELDHLGVNCRLERGAESAYYLRVASCTTPTAGTRS